jgi:hypothetical protein
MIQVTINNELDNRSFGARFESQELADAWILDNVSNNSWGKGIRTEFFISLDSVPAEMQPRILSVDNVMEEDVMTGVNVTFKADYIISQTDITAIHEEEEQLALIGKKIDFGRDIIVKINHMNEVRGFTTDIIAALAVQFAPIVSLLQVGALDTALGAMTQVEPNEILDQAYKTELLAFVAGKINLL